jgi:hypothetical protein
LGGIFVDMIIVSELKLGSVDCIYIAELNRFAENELPRGKPRSIGAKTTGVARNKAGYIPLPWRTPLSESWQDMHYDLAKQKHCGFFGRINSCSHNNITQFSQQAAGN